MQPIQKSAPLATIAYKRIKQSILDGTLAPSQIVNEPQLAQALQISRTPVREALIRLEQEGWVMPADGRGLVVRPLSPRDVEDIYEMRLLLEPYAARLFAERADDAEIVALLEPLEEIEAEIAVGRYDLYFQMHRALHQRLIDHCPNLILREVLASLDERTHRIRVLTGSEPGRHVRASFEEQKTIMQALERRDLNQIEHAVADHLSAAKARVLSHLAARRDSSNQGAE